MYCPYCKKNVPYRKVRRGGAMTFGIIASTMAPLYMFIFLLFIWRLLGYIILAVAITIFVIFEVLYWRWYKKKLRYYCIFCKTTVQPKSESSDTLVEPSEGNVAYCQNCGAAKGKESASFCSYCGTKF